MTFSRLGSVRRFLKTTLLLGSLSLAIPPEARGEEFQVYCDTIEEGHPDYEGCKETPERAFFKSLTSSEEPASVAALQSTASDIEESGIDWPKGLYMGVGWGFDVGCVGPCLRVGKGNDYFALVGSIGFFGAEGSFNLFLVPISWQGHVRKGHVRPFAFTGFGAAMWAEPVSRFGFGVDIRSVSRRPSDEGVRIEVGLMYAEWFYEFIGNPAPSLTGTWMFYF